MSVDIGDLRRRLGSAAEVVASDGTEAYDVARRMVNRRFEPRPLAVVYCATAPDVTATIAFAREGGLVLTTRAGGCSPAGWSGNDGGLILDVSRMDGVEIDVEGGTVGVGAGVRLGSLYRRLGAQEVVVPGGECPVVGVAGYVLGGGLSILGRSLGLGCDSLVAAEMVDADGMVVACDEERNADLLWALRGAGGGNFGVVTSLTLRTHRITPRVLCATVEWPLEQAVDVLDELLPYFAGEAPRELDALFWLVPGPRGRKLTVVAVYDGEGEEARTAMEQVTRRGRPDRVEVKPRPFHEFLSDDFPAPPRDIHEFFKSGFLAEPPPREALELLVQEYAASDEAHPGIQNLVTLELTCGAVHDVPSTATAFVHRDQFAVLSIIANWMGQERNDPPELRWAEELHRRMQPWFTGQAYQNYPDPSIEDWLSACYGDNAARLLEVKERYDPADVFRFRGGVDSLAAASPDR